MPLQDSSPFHGFILPQAPPLDCLRRVMDTSHFWTLVPAHHQTCCVPAEVTLAMHRNDP